MTRPSRDEPLQFAILGGFERGFGIFISRVERSTKAEEIGLKRGDQVINIRCGRIVRILKWKQNLGVTFNFNKHDVIDFTKCAGPRSKFIKVVVDPLFLG